ncbi:DNA repair protein endonuclease SAE2/CtIP C-terminus-domain-containing protein [Flammula alnicola]|nr:DNA repair protein endonuclease SAE2/CtIP C-terminus-domain-containing protein [Flammula alnicola]
MASEKATYSRTFLRERDQIVSEKHQSEINALNQKHFTLKRQADEISKNLFDSNNRGRRLAALLGYNDVYDAFIDIESAEHGILFRECVERVQTAEAQLSIEKTEVEILQAKLRKLEQAHRTLAAEKRELDARYDALKDTKERAAERYKVDYKKWRAVSKWLFSDDPDDDNNSGVTTEEKKKIRPNLLRKRQKMVESGFNLSRFAGEPENSEDPLTPRTGPPPLGRIEMGCDKENEGTPMPPLKKRRISKNASTAPTPVLPHRNTLLASVTNIAPPSSSPTIFLDTASATNSRTTATTRVPLSFQHIPDTIHINQEPSSTPSPVLSRTFRDTQAKSPLSSQNIPHSSDTEDDSQAIWLPSTTKHSGNPVVFKVPAPPPKAGPNRQNEQVTNTPHPSLPSRPSFAQKPAEPGPSRRRSAIAEPMRIDESSPHRHPPSRKPDNTRRHSTNERSTTGDVSSSSVSGRPEGPFSSIKGKERHVESDVTTPLTSRNQGQKRLEDYSAFKGHGRYGKANEPAQPTINTLFAIDPARNGGLNYQYDEVVRRRDERRKLNAGDCECCREYYEGVGPLPSRLQQPLWRSPTTSPVKPCSRHPNGRTEDDGRGATNTLMHRQHDPHGASGPSSGRRQAEIDSHKKAISRHRHTWARAPTPPGYWNIGFPDTQEVGDINEKAKEMHKRKKDEIDREAAEGGRYRRK